MLQLHFVLFHVAHESLKIDLDYRLWLISAFAGWMAFRPVSISFGKQIVRSKWRLLFAIWCVKVVLDLSNIVSF